MENRHGSSRALTSAGSGSAGGKSGPSIIGRNWKREAITLCFYGASIFTLVALWTWVPGDPSWFSSSKGAALNACGKAGAWIASLVLHSFGIAGFLVPAALAFAGVGLHKEEGHARFWGALSGMVLSVVSLTIFLSIQWKYWPFSGQLLLTGGALGYWAAEGLISQFNPLGSSIVSLLIFLLTFALSTPVSIVAILTRLGAFVGALSWKFTRIAGTALAYGAGVVAMRGAHVAGDWLQKLMENGIKKARERRQPKPAESSEVGGESVVASPKKSRKAESEPEGSKKDIIDVQAEPVLVSSSASVIIPSEAPNVLETLKASKEPVRSDAKTRLVPESEVSLEEEIEEESDEGEELEASEGDGDDSAESGEEETSNDAEDGGQAPKKRASQKPEQLSMVEVPIILPDAVPSASAQEDKSVKSTIKTVIKELRKARGQWKLPALQFLKTPPKGQVQIDHQKLEQNMQLLEEKFKEFQIEGKVTAVRPGPVITLYEFKPAPGVRVSKIASLADDLSMALSAQSVRILAPLPGKAVVGIEIPSEARQMVYFRELLDSPDFFGGKHSIPVVMGKDIGGQPVIADLAKMPHLLCAGQTGSGKSVFMNGLICSMLYRYTPDQMRMILIDPKFNEFIPYQDMPHLLLPVVDDPRHASNALKWAVREMDRRYRILAMLGAKNLAAYNQKVDEMGADVVRDLLMSEAEQTEGLDKMTGGDWIASYEQEEDGSARIGRLPYIVIIIDELADLMMMAKKEVEMSIARIAQKARAAGIHLVIATQRPSTDVVTGLIKANLPSRLSFQLASYTDSRTILDRQGAERLLGQGDMLFIPPGTSSLVRLTGAYLEDSEINKIASFLKEQGKPVYRNEILEDESEDGESEDEDGGEEKDDLFDEAVELARKTGLVSASSLQRHFRIGYNRAARMVETMESRGIVGPQDGARPREVLLR